LEEVEAGAWGTDDFEECSASVPSTADETSAIVSAKDRA
jgi:hypothetical protein